MNNIANILIGCDPEVFVRQGGSFKSAHGLIEGNKRFPKKIRSGAVQVDGMALEFNIDPASSEDEFVFLVTDVFDQLKKMVPEYEVVTTPVAHFDPLYMKEQPEEALELGCDPDFNAWTNEANQRPDGDRPMRTASGHVHIGWTEGAKTRSAGHVRKCYDVVRQMDFFVGLGSLFYDADTQRREMYGRAGACRIKSYGVEYRTLSNRWLSDEALMRWVYRNTRKGVETLFAGRKLVDIYGDIQDIINTSDKTEAMKIMKAEGLEVPSNVY